MHYLVQNLRRDVKHLTRISFYQRSDYLALDYTTLRHLEILEPQHHDAPRNSSLYGALNRTVTPMGARLLRQWLSQPLSQVAPIHARQNAVQTFIENSFGLDAFRQQLTNVRDLERTIGRISTGSGNARDLVALRLALEQIPALKQTLETLIQNRRAELIEVLNTQLTTLPDLVDLISRAIVDEPPLPIKEGGMIRDGFDAALDELKLDRQPHVTVLDLTTDFTNADGSLKKDLFTPDNIHLSLAGYDLYAQRLKPLFDKLLVPGGK